MILKNIKAVLFDFDDTLGNRDQYAYDCYRSVITEYTTLTDPIEIEAVVQQCMIWDQKGDVNKNEVKKKLEKEFGIVLPVEDFNTYWDAHLYQFCVPFPETRETLEALKKNYRIGLLTNGPSFGQRNKLKQAGLDDLFDEDNMIVSGDYGFHKPDVRLFQKACEKLGVRPEECVYVGDLFARDVLGAYRAGMTPVWIFKDTDRACHAQVLRISSIGQIRDLLQ